MSRDPVILRVDATSQSGYERLARCTTLAAALQRRRRPVYFLSQLEPNSLAMNIKRGGNNWILADHPAGSEDDVNQTLATTIVLIEHDIGMVMGLSHHVVVLDYGRKVGDGSPEEVRRNPDVIAAYLGVKH